MKHRKTTIVMAGILTLGTTLMVERVRASGIPTTNALTYSGYLENPDGTPVSGEKNIELVMYDAETDGDDICRTDAEVTLADGRFQLVLPVECTAGVKANPDLWVELEVDGSTVGRTKLGAVPYAVEAGHALIADAATAATGALDDALVTLEERVGKLESRVEVKSAGIGADGSETAAWISGVTHSGTGSYQIAFSAGAFTSAPACVVTAAAGDSKSPAFECFNTSASGIECRANIHDPNPAALGIAVDSAFFILCATAD